MSDFDEIDYDRDYPRETIRANTQVKIDERWYDCVIVNMTPKGAKLQIDRKVGRGTAVFIKIGEFGQFSATVAWCQGDEIGVKFDHDPAQMTRVLIDMESKG